MKFSQEQLESMSDFELNVVAANLFYDGGEITTSPAKFGVQVHVNGAFVDDSYNPCGSWSDCGDLIDECKLSLCVVDDGDYRVNDRGIHHSGRIINPMSYYYDKNPKRAVTIVYILVKQFNG